MTATHRALAVGSNAFVAMPEAWRCLLFLYVFVWQVAPTLLSPMLHGAVGEYSAVRAILVASNAFLLALPLLLTRFAGMPVGWLHPMVFPTLFVLALDLARDPLSFTYPLTVWCGDIQAPAHHPLLLGYSAAVVTAAQAGAEALVTLSIVSYYLGMAFLRLPVPRIHWYEPRYLGAKMLFVIGTLLLITVYLVQSRGGIVQHMASFGLGRHVGLHDIGPTITAIRMIPMFLVIWYVLDRTVIRRPVFIGLFMLGVAAQFVVTGSRSWALYPVVFLLACYIYHSGRVPSGRIVVVGMFAFLAAGALGQVRRSADAEAGTVQVSLPGVGEIASETMQEAAERSAAHPYVVVVARVPGDLQFLKGDSYINALTFFVPRVLWEGKPRAIGAYSGAMLFQGLDTAEGYTGAGTTPGPVGEAYWNFYVPGVIVVFLLFGAYQRWIAGILLRHPGTPGAAAFYLFSLLFFMAPGTDQIANFIRQLLVALMLFYFLGVLRVRKSVP